MRIFIALLAASVAPGAVVTEQFGTSTIRANGAMQAEQSQVATDSFASTQAIWPPSPTAAQGRTAARSRAEEIAANAMILDTSFTGVTFDEVISAAQFNLTVSPELIVRHATLEFFLPPSYMEVVSNAETYFNVMETVLLANVRICYADICNFSDQRFQFQAVATVSFLNREYDVQATGDPAFDLSGLQNPIVTFTPNGFLNTYHVAFPEFTGILDVGDVPAGVPITVEYQIQARASGRALLNTAIAAINDPFLLSTDPVLQGTPLQLTFTPVVDTVPEPSTVLLVLSGVAMAVVRRMNQFR